jgi:phosphate-selective porin OprO/OprP
MCHGVNLFDKRLDYGVAVSNGQRNGDYDSNMLKDVNGRLAVRPFADTDLLKGWQIGFSMGTGVEEEPVSPNPLRTPGNVPFLQFNSTVRANGRRIRYSPELAYCYGPLGLAAQYFHMEQRLQPTFSGPGSSYILQIPFEGFYVMGTLLLTGEKRTSYKEQLAPLHPFDPCHFCHAPGAWELVGRVSRLEVGSQVFQPLPVSQTSYVNLANPIGNSSGATEMTLGFNWYLNSWVRLQFNWEHAWFDQAVRLGPGPDGLMRHQDSLLVRTQIIF